MSDLQNCGNRNARKYEKNPKGGKQRIVPLNLDARRALQDWLNARPEDGTDFIWIAVESDQEQALSSRSVQRALTRIYITPNQADLERAVDQITQH